MVNEPTSRGNTPLYWAADQDHLDIIKWWIASGREMDLGTPGEQQSDAILVAKKKRRKEVIALLERFKNDPTKTRSEVRLELGINGSDPFFFFFSFSSFLINFQFPFSPRHHQISLCPPHQSSPGSSTSPSLINPLRRFCLQLPLPRPRHPPKVLPNHQLPLLLLWLLPLLLPNRSSNLLSHPAQPRKRRMPSSPPSPPRRTPFPV